MLASRRPSASGLGSRALVTLGLALGLFKAPGGGPSGARAATSAAHLGRHSAQPFLRRHIESAAPALMGIDRPGEACGEGQCRDTVAAIGSAEGGTPARVPRAGETIPDGWMGH